MPPDADASPVPEPPAAALPALVEALLFVADGPVEEPALARAFNVTRRRVEHALEALGEALGDRGVRLQRGPEGVQLVTAAEAAVYVEHFLGLQSGRRLSSAALETLAIVAYRQPVTRATIESIRGVNSDAAVTTLRARGLIDESGRAPGPGRPTLFATTQRFLEHFGLERPDDLPPLDDIEMPPPDAPLPLPETAPQREQQRYAATARRLQGATPRQTPGPHEEARAGRPLPGRDVASDLPSNGVALPRAGAAPPHGGTVRPPG